MQRWEYLELKSIRVGIWRAETKDRPEGEEIEMDRLNEVMNYLGEQGWEIVWLAGGTWFFKRPLE